MDYEKTTGSLRRGHVNKVKSGFWFGNFATKKQLNTQFINAGHRHEELKSYGEAAYYARRKYIVHLPN